MVSLEVSGCWLARTISFTVSAYLIFRPFEQFPESPGVSVGGCLVLLVRHGGRKVNARTFGNTARRPRLTHKQALNVFALPMSAWRRTGRCRPHPFTWALVIWHVTEGASVNFVFPTYTSTTPFTTCTAASQSCRLQQKERQHVKQLSLVDAQTALQSSHLPLEGKTRQRICTTVRTSLLVGCDHCL